MFKPASILLILIISNHYGIHCRPTDGDDKLPRNRPISNNWGLNLERQNRVESMPPIQDPNGSSSIPKFIRRPSLKHDVVNRPNSWGMGGKMKNRNNWNNQK